MISQGFSGQELLKRFNEQSKRIRPAVRKLISEADDLVKSNKGKISLDELLGAEDQ